MKQLNDLPTSKLTWTSETVVNQSTQFRHIETGDILTFFELSKKSFQKIPLTTFKRVSDGNFFDYPDNEVERISQ